MPLCCIVYDEERKPHSALSPYRFGVGWLFSSVLLIAVFGDTENVRTWVIIKSAPFLYAPT